MQRPRSKPVVIRAARDAQRCQLRPMHQPPLRPRNLGQPPIPSRRNLQNPTYPSGHLDLAGKCLPHAHNPPNLPTQHSFAGKYRLTCPHIDKSLQTGPIHPPPSQSLTKDRTVTSGQQPAPHRQGAPRAPYRARRANSTPAAMTETRMMATLQATAVTAADPGACPLRRARSESITAVTGW